MIEAGRAGAYLALFSEIGFVLLVTTLAGVGLGIWADAQLGTKPVVTVIGFLAGAGLGFAGMWRLVTRFLQRLDDAERRPPGGAGG
jgi:F0F1-type ATP synthase assembly protein I